MFRRFLFNLKLKLNLKTNLIDDCRFISHIYFKLKNKQISTFFICILLKYNSLQFGEHLLFLIE